MRDPPADPELHRPGRKILNLLLDLATGRTPTLGTWVHGKKNLVCTRHDKLLRHNLVGGALLKVAESCRLATRRANVVDMRRRLPDG
eukprot:SAG31_NODE_9983_length_1201_cov_1.162432_1_plen_87_part_00